MKINCISNKYLQSFQSVKINKAISKNASVINEALNKIENLSMDSEYKKIGRELPDKEHQIHKKWSEKYSDTSLQIFYDKLLYKEKREIIDLKAENNDRKQTQLNRNKSEAEEIAKIVSDLKDNIQNNQKAEAIKRAQQSKIIPGTFRKNKGFSQIAGYDKEKSILQKYFISELAKAKNGEKADIPNAVLFFGPKGNGKTTFAKAFAQEIGCEKPIEIRSLGLNTEKICNNFHNSLIKSAQKAEEYYKKTGDYSVIFIDEIINVSNKDSTILPELEEFLRTCGEKYHCIVFAATNSPLNINLPLTSDESVFSYIVSVDPPNKENKAKILEYYLNGRIYEKEQPDYNQLAGLLEQNETEKGGKYSISQIRNEICRANTDELVNINNVIDTIKQSSPTIKDNQLSEYNEAMNILMQNEIES